ncbi:hypothetical protein COV18_02910 [Candidatus Woesearchaeota archaeon CG10_big_fil_rev_8_21_14_0_10_37_12]|nr:MAG: hypothetical protein COV18_02910 [Candidatus Woesearchaeota archaeon CG10_big_fil_rev_8_21_14_0_10_37_12]
MFVEIVFWILLVPLAITLLVMYIRSKKLYRLFYLLSIFTYAMLILYVIDSYELGANAIILLLVISAILMILIGYYKFRTVKKTRR